MYLWIAFYAMKMALPVNHSPITSGLSASNTSWSSVFPFPLSLSLCVSAIPHSGLVSANALLSQVEKVKDDTTDQVFNLTTRRDASFKIRVSYLVNAEAGAGAGGGAERQAL